MQPIQSICGIAAPLLVDNIDTDQIIPVHRMLASMNPDYGAGLFANWRYLADGTPNADFVLSKEPFTRAQILIAGANFGCGSSREHAVWALQGFGICCVIAASFADIFFSNCVRRGLLPVALPTIRIRDLESRIVSSGGREPLTVSLVDRTIRLAGGPDIAFRIDDGLRTNLLEGLDEIGHTLRYLERIEAHEREDRGIRPWVYPMAPVSPGNFIETESVQPIERGHE
jgi:3-isopropylmalate/(R)-2-methylmalate dehydratase small subunit